MALLQVHQAKALRYLHEGGHDLAVLHELRAATDLVLRATKVTAQSLGRAMSTLVIQERHLWLCLTDMKDNKILPFGHLSQLGFQVNWGKSKLVPMQRISFLGMELDSVNQTARLTQVHAQSVLNCLKTLSGRTVVPLKLFQRLLGHMAAAAAKFRPVCSI